MEDPLYTAGFIRDIIKARHKDIAGLTIAKGGRLKIGRKRSKTAYLFSLFLIMGPYHFFRNSFKTLLFKTKKRLAGVVPGIKSPGLAEYASGFDIPVSYTSNPNDELFLAKLRQAAPDVIINQSQFMIKKPLLDLAKIGMLNRHNALLPKNRGRLTPFWVLFNGEKETGVSIHFVNEGIDAGQIVVQKKIPVSSRETFNTLVEKNYKIASDAMLEALERVENSSEDFIPNDDQNATYNTVPTIQEAIRFRFRMLAKYRYFLVTLYVLFVISLHVIQIESGIAFDEIRVLNIRGDYLLHVTIFFPWMSLVRLNLSGRRKKTNVYPMNGSVSDQMRRIIRAVSGSPAFWFMAGLLLAVIAETIQALLPHRSFNLMDMWANAVGVIVGSIVYIDRLFRR